MNKSQVKSIIGMAHDEAVKHEGLSPSEQTLMERSILLASFMKEVFVDLSDTDGYFSSEELELFSKVSPVPKPEVKDQSHLAAAYVAVEKTKKKVKAEEIAKHPLIVLIKESLNLPNLIPANVIEMATSKINGPYKNGVRESYPDMLTMYSSSNVFQAFCAERLGQMKVITKERGYIFDWPRAVKHLHDLWRPATREDGAAQWPGYLVWASLQVKVEEDPAQRPVEVTLD